MNKKEREQSIKAIEQYYADQTLTLQYFECAFDKWVDCGGTPSTKEGRLKEGRLKKRTEG